MANNIGTKFEIYVENLFRDLGKFRVKRNVNYQLQRRFTKKLVKIVQIDVQFYDFFGKYIVECKYLNNGNVGDDVVNKVKKNLEYLGLEKAIIATNQDFQMQAKRLAKKYGIKLYNKKILEKLDYERLSFIEMIAKKVKNRTLEEQVDKIKLENYSNKPIMQVKYVW